MGQRYLTAYQANQETKKNIQKQIDIQKDAVFRYIEQAICDGKFSTQYNYLNPEVQKVLIDYGYGVVCPDDGGKCWEISWDSSITPQIGRK